MQQFIGRHEELDALERRWGTASSEFVVMYGRRRVGKSALIRQFAKGRRAVFSVGSKAGRSSQISHFLSEVGLLAADPGLAALLIHDWNVALQRLNAAITAHKGKTLIVLDEFQWMAGAAPELPSLLQTWWDSTWSASGKVFLIVCGSLLGFMEREVLGNKSPLFGRKTAVIRLLPLGFAESRLFHPHTPLREQMMRFLICGGVPAYHKLFPNERSFSSALSDLFFDIDAPLAEEADYLLMEELRDPKLYFSILEQLGLSSRTVTQMAQAVGIERSKIPYYTKNLQQLGYIQKDTPLLRYRDKNQRIVRYRIADPLLRFWFSFVYQHQNALYRMNRATFYAVHVAPTLDAYFGHAFESVAAELYAQKRIAPGTPEPWKIGSYWDRTCQIDFTVALKSGFSYLGEVKWAKVNTSAIQAFSEKVQSLTGGISCRPVLVSMEAVSAHLRKNAGDVDLCSIAELV